MFWLPPVSIPVTVKMCSPLLEVSTVPVHASPLLFCVQEVCLPVACVQTAAVRYGPTGLERGFDVVGLLQAYTAVTTWPLAYVMDFGDVIVIPGQISPGVS